MSMQAVIEEKLAQQIHPSHLQVINESGNHNVPPGSESHFKVVIVADSFDGKPLIARHRMINEVLAEELQNNIHALALHTYAPDEWQETGQAPDSPPCHGGGK
ncbi:BolA family protein [Thiohalophilus sp.]|uniref:BolA family protein n=1 Tax=Thiohalophilus sp. TaxID=3028392 RepID=UPI002ACDF47E|nr:BolA/IbaG family iron-sulfur metabolism protein [Thiohalophilus sp.]MDZ7662433.1 BolA/IbaG family iron-sulfur metabolism protein [Thiohalophilus sp.]